MAFVSVFVVKNSVALSDSPFKIAFVFFTAIGAEFYGFSVEFVGFPAAVGFGRAGIEVFDAGTVPTVATETAVVD